MRKTIVVSCVVATLCLIQSSIAADTDRSADHDTLRALRDKAEKAINIADMQELRACLAKDFTFITSDQTVLTNLTGITEYWDSMFKNKQSPVAAMKTTFTADILTQFYGPDIGYCRGTSRDVYTLRKGPKIAMTNTWSVTLIKEDNAWKISNAHIGVNFLDNPVLAAREMSWFGKLCMALHLRKLPGRVQE